MLNVCMCVRACGGAVFQVEEKMQRSKRFGYLGDWKKADVPGM